MTKCPYCEYKTTDIEQFKSHIVAHIRDKNYRCLLCNRLYKYRGTSIKGKISKISFLSFDFPLKAIVHFIFVENIIDLVAISTIIFNDLFLIRVMPMNRHQINLEDKIRRTTSDRQIISIRHEKLKNQHDISVVLIVITHRIMVEMFGKINKSISIFEKEILFLII